MNEELIAVRAVSFGIFELDLRSQELRQGGLGLKLEAQPLQLLELLLERAGELVTRKELRERLWPGSFVQFDRCINTAISKLRKTLGDTTDSPRYIETRSRLGYRFIASVGVADVGPRPGLPPVPPDATPTGQPVPIGFSAQRSSPSAPFATIANPRVDGDALRFQVQRPDGNLVELSLRLTTTKEGALNMRLDFGGAGSEEGRQVTESGLALTMPGTAPRGTFEKRQEPTVGARCAWKRKARLGLGQPVGRGDQGAPAWANSVDRTEHSESSLRRTSR